MSSLGAWVAPSLKVLPSPPSRETLSTIFPEEAGAPRYQQEGLFLEQLLLKDLELSLLFL